MAREVEFLATDASEDALQLARENAVGHGVADQTEFVVGDLLPDDRQPPFDMVLANLPYIPSGMVDHLPVAASFEPRSALDGGPDGLSVIRRLLDRLPGTLADGGVALLEIGADQSEAIRAEVARRLPGWASDIELDLAGQPRVVRIQPVAGAIHG
jgi:release factor glutamine methyltransferase